MTDTSFDFERFWQNKLHRAVSRRRDDQLAEQILEGGDQLDQDSSPEQKTAWTLTVLDRLDREMDPGTRQEILTECACQYPPDNLVEERHVFQETGSVDLVLTMLQNKFESFLRDDLELEEDLIREVVSRGWGLAGVRQGATIIATKIPKSGSLKEYFQTDDPEEKRRLYCHCPRIRDRVGREPTLPPVYCYCGAGFYKGIWETILDQPVQVTLLNSVLQDDQVCRAAVQLPEGIV